ncbi:zeta toxin family protein [Agrobacterium rubi]|uniref:zeta toxin family protein n=1 Tax=Agrobacterium rubi TaxID=28099 RepID=UPI000AD95E27|nr:zeta toxin family protein [Agrobacterium rubi]
MPELSCILLAGPNGSGKSSAFAKLDLEGVWINADEIAKAIPSDRDGRSTDMQAGRAALMKIAEMIRTRQSFIFETTLSSQQSIRLTQEAK